MKNLFLAAALSLAAVPAVAHDWHAGNNTPNNPNNTGGVESAYDAGHERYADRRDYRDADSDSHDFWRDRATPTEQAMWDRTNAERAWDGLPHYY